MTVPVSVDNLSKMEDKIRDYRTDSDARIAENK